MARPRGSKNKRTLLQNAVTSLGVFSTQMSKIISEWLVDPDPDKQRDAVKSLARYVWPTLQAVEVTGPDGGPIQSEITTRGAQVAEFIKTLKPETRKEMVNAAKLYRAKRG